MSFERETVALLFLDMELLDGQKKALKLMEKLDRDSVNGYRKGLKNKIILRLAKMYAGQDPVDLFKACKTFIYPELAEDDKAVENVLKPLRDML